jgi:hypothetical protein
MVLPAGPFVTGKGWAGVASTVDMLEVEKTVVVAECD